MDVQNGLDEMNTFTTKIHLKTRWTILRFIIIIHVGSQEQKSFKEKKWLGYLNIIMPCMFYCILKVTKVQTWMVDEEDLVSKIFIFHHQSKASKFQVFVQFQYTCQLGKSAENYRKAQNHQNKICFEQARNKQRDLQEYLLFCYKVILYENPRCQIWYLNFKNIHKQIYKQIFIKKKKPCKNHLFGKPNLWPC